MVEKEVTVHNASGLHARPASVFVKEAVKFRSTVFIEKDGSEYNAKSIFNILSAGVKKDSVIRIRCSGEDEAQALQRLAEIVEAGLGE